MRRHVSVHCIARAVGTVCRHGRNPRGIMTALSDNGGDPAGKTTTDELLAEIGDEAFDINV